MPETIILKAGYDGSELDSGLDRSDTRVKRSSQSWYEELQKMAGGVRGFAKGYQGDMQTVETANRRTIGDLLNIKNILLTMGAVAGVASISSMFLNAAKAGIAFNLQMEQSKIGFTQMLGGAQKANDMMEKLYTFAAKTPFEFGQLVSATQRLLAFGFAADRLIPTLTAVGDAVSALGGSSYEIDRVVFAMGQMLAKGKTSAEEMMQLAEVGIPAWDLIAEGIGKTTAETMALSEKGLIPAQKAIDALTTGMEKRWAGMMDVQSRSLQGLFSTLKDNITLILGISTEPLFNQIKVQLNNLLTFTDRFAERVKDKGLFGGIAAELPFLDGAIKRVKTIGNELAAIGKDVYPILKGLVEGIKSVFGPALTAGLQLAVAVLDSFRRILELIPQPLLQTIAVFRGFTIALGMVTKSVSFLIPSLVGLIPFLFKAGTSFLFFGGGIKLVTGYIDNLRLKLNQPGTGIIEGFKQMGEKATKAGSLLKGLSLGLGAVAAAGAVTAGVLYMMHVRNKQLEASTATVTNAQKALAAATGMKWAPEKKFQLPAELDVKASTDSFRLQMEREINDLSNMSRYQQRAKVIQMAVGLVLQGNDPEKVREEANRLLKAAGGLTIPVTLDLLSPTVITQTWRTTISELIQEVNEYVAQNTNYMSGIPAAMPQEIVTKFGSMGKQLALMWNSNNPTPFLTEYFNALQSINTLMPQFRAQALSGLKEGFKDLADIGEMSDKQFLNIVKWMEEMAKNAPTQEMKNLAASFLLVYENAGGSEADRVKAAITAINDELADKIRLQEESAAAAEEDAKAQEAATLADQKRTQAITSISSALQKFVAPQNLYQKILADLNKEGQEAVDKYNEAASKAAGKYASLTFGTSDSAEDYYKPKKYEEKKTISLTKWASEIKKQTEKLKTWLGNLTKIGAIFGPAVRDYLMELGPDYAEVVEEMAAEGWKPGTGANEAGTALKEYTAATDDIAAGKQYDLWTKLQEAALVGGGQWLDLLNQYTGTEYEKVLQLMVGASSQYGTDAWTALIQALRGSGADVLSVAGEYNALLAAGVNPIIVAVGGRPIASTSGSFMQYNYPASWWVHGGSRAEGGFMPNHAVIGSPSPSVVQWREPETGGEAYIPLAPGKRARSIGIWAQTGRLLGVMADGGVYDQLNYTLKQIGAFVGPARSKYFNLGAGLAYGYTKQKALDWATKQDQAQRTAGSIAAPYAGPTSSSRAAIIEFGKQFVGKVPYVWGGESPAGWDCSGFQYYLMRHAGINIGRSTAAGYQAKFPRVTSPAVGDFLFHGKPAHHIMMYIGNNRVLESGGHATAVLSGQPWTTAGRSPYPLSSVAHNIPMANGGFIGVPEVYSSDYKPRNKSQANTLATYLLKGFTLSPDASDNWFSYTFANGGILDDFGISDADIAKIAKELSSKWKTGTTSSSPTNLWFPNWRRKGGPDWKEQFNAAVVAKLGQRLTVPASYVSAANAQVGMYQTRTAVTGVDTTAQQKSTLNLQLSYQKKEIAEAQAYLNQAAKDKDVTLDTLNQLREQLYGLITQSYQTQQAIEDINNAIDEKKFATWSTVLGELDAQMSLLSEHSKGFSKIMADSGKYVGQRLVNMASQYTQVWDKLKKSTNPEDILNYGQQALGQLSNMFAAEKDLLSRALDDTMQQIDKSAKAIDDQYEAQQKAYEASSRDRERNKTLGDLNSQISALTNAEFKTQDDVQRLRDLQKQLDETKEQYAREDFERQMQEEYEAKRKNIEDLQKQAEDAYKAEVDALVEHYDAMMTTVMDKQQELLGAADDYSKAGTTLGNSFAEGLMSSIPEIQAAAAAAAASAAEYLELHSPAEKGPLANLDTWWEAFTKTLAKPVTNSIGPAIGEAMTTSGRFEQRVFIDLHITGDSIQQEAIPEIAERVGDYLKRSIDNLAYSYSR